LLFGALSGEMDTLSRRIDSILNMKWLDDVDGDTSRAEEIEKLADEVEWTQLQRVLLDFLRDGSRTIDQWRVIATVFWGAVLDGRDLAADEVIALVYHRLPTSSDTEESNLPWSIASKIRGVGYNSDFDPLTDPNVRRYLPNAGTE
jgi:hypothetical protein